jgi:hypothetical protein
VGTAALTSAQATIQYSGIQNLTVSMAGSLQTTEVNLDFSGPSEFTLNGMNDPAYKYSPSIGWLSFDYKEGSTLGSQVTPAAGTVSQVSAGAIVGAGSTFMMSTNAFFVSGPGAGTWADGQTAYFGFRFAPAGTVLYGWGRMRRSGTDLTLEDWAYDDSGSPINAGSTGTSPAEPFITGITLGAGNQVTIAFTCSDNAAASAFRLKTSSAVGPSAAWATDTGATISSNTPGVYQAITTATGGSGQFYIIGH